MKIGQKIIFASVCIALLIGVIGYIALSLSRKILEENIGKDSVAHVKEVIDRIDRNIYRRVVEMKAYGKDLILQKALLESNEEFRNYDNLQEIKQRIREREIFPREILSGSLAEELKEKISFYRDEFGYEVYFGVSVANKYGVVISSTKEDNGYLEISQEWFDKALETNGVWVGDVKYQPDSKGYYCDIVIKVYSGKEFIGIIRAVLNIEGIVDLIRETQNTSVYKSTRYRLCDKDGNIIFASGGDFKFSENIYSFLIKQFGRKTDPEHINYKIGDKGRKLFAHVHSRGYKNYKGLGWIFLLEYDTREIFVPINKLRGVLLFSFCLAVVFAVAVGAFVSHIISVPIVRLRDTAIRIGKGELGAQIEIKSKDEIGDLAASINQMSLGLKDMYNTEKRAVESEKRKAAQIEKLKDELELKVSERTAELQDRLAELERFENATTDREFRMEALQKEIAELRKKLKERKQ